jgi:hypothetical protein
MAANRTLVQHARRGCRSSLEAHSLADVFDLDVVAEARHLQLAGKLFFARDGPNDALVLNLKNKATGRNRGQAAGGHATGGAGAAEGRGRESATALPAAAESEPGEASSEEEGDDASWVTDISCGSDSDGGSSGSGREPSGGRAVRRRWQAADDLVGWSGTVIDRLLHSLSKSNGPGSLQLSWTGCASSIARPWSCRPSSATGRPSAPAHSRH